MLGSWSYLVRTCLSSGSFSKNSTRSSKLCEYLGERKPDTETQILEKRPVKEEKEQERKKWRILKGILSGSSFLLLFSSPSSVSQG